MVDKQLALELYKNGLTLREIGEVFNVSRQRINQIMRSYSAPRNNNRAREASAPNESELWIGELLREKGHSVRYQPYMDVYDIFLDGRFRIEVKHAKVGQKDLRNHRGGNNYYEMGALNQDNFDFLIAICGDLSNPVTYIIPSAIAPKYLTLPVTPKFNTRYQRLYREAWNLLKLTP